MPGTHVALLRGVNNIGATTRITMAELREALEGVGLREVQTLLNSGNVVFTAPANRRDEILDRIQRALARLRVTPVVTLLRAHEVREVVRDNPLAAFATRPSDLLVSVAHATKDLQALLPLTRKRWAPERLALGRRVAYQWCARGIAKSPLRIAVERALGNLGTGRNIATFTKLVAALETP